MNTTTESNVTNGRIKNFLSGVLTNIVTLAIVATISYLIASKASVVSMEQQMVFLRDELKRMERRIELLDEKLETHGNLDGHTGTSGRIGDMMRKIERLEDRGK